MNDDGIVVAALSFQIIDTVADGFLPRAAAGDDPFELVDVELSGISPDDIVPAVDANDLDRIDLGMFLKAFQRIDQDRLVIYVDKLLGDILSHPVSGASGNDDRNVHALSPSRSGFEILFRGLII